MGWYTKEVIVIYVECERYGEKECQVDDNRKQGVIRDRQRWCECQKKKKEEAVQPGETNVQQSSAQSGEPENIAKEGGS